MIKLESIFCVEFHYYDLHAKCYAKRMTTYVNKIIGDHHLKSAVQCSCLRASCNMCSCPGRSVGCLWLGDVWEALRQSQCS